MSTPAGSPPGGQREGSGGSPTAPHPPGIAAAISEVSDRASILIREEIELAKAEIGEKATRLAKGAVVGIVAGVFFLGALFFVLVGCAWLLYYELPIGNEFTYFWGFFAMAVILVILGALAGFVAARALRSGTPPTPEMAIEEARKIRETVGAAGAPGSPGSSGPLPPVPVQPAPTEWPGGEPASSPTPPIPTPGGSATSGGATDTDTKRGGGYGTAISG